MLFVVVIIRRDHAGADVGRGSDAGIADVAQMISLGAGFDQSVFDLDEIADVRTVAEPRVGPQPERMVRPRRVYRRERQQGAKTNG